MKRPGPDKKSSCSRPAPGGTGPSRREFFRLAGLGSLALLTARRARAEALADSTEAPKARYYGALAELPVGAVKPRGWMLEGNEIQGFPAVEFYPEGAAASGAPAPSAITHFRR